MSRRRRVLYVENGIGYGGAIICLRHLVRNLDPDHYDAMVVTGRGEPLYRDIANETTWKHIPDRRFDVVGMRRKLAAASWVRRIPGLHFVLNQFIARLDDVGNFLPFFIQFLLTARRFKPDIIHVNNEPLCNRASILAGRLLDIPVVCHVRGEPNLTQTVSSMYRLPNHFIPVSHWVSAGIGELGVAPERRTVVYDGIALQDLDTATDGKPFRREFGIADDEFVVGLIGLLIPWKGQQLFLDAARALHDEIPGLRMLIIGGTPLECQAYEQQLRQRVREDGLEDCVVFTGHMDDMPMVYNALDIVVSASTSPEPLGTVVIECMAMGRTLIAPAHGGGAEMNEHGVTALLFEPGNADSFADAVRRLYHDPQLRQQLGKAAREKALRTFAVEEHVRGVAHVYDRLLEQPAPGTSS